MGSTAQRDQDQDRIRKTGVQGQGSKFSTRSMRNPEDARGSQALVPPAAIAKVKPEVYKNGPSDPSRTYNLEE